MSITPEHLAPPPSAPALVMIVDDHDDSRALMTMMIEASGFRAASADGPVNAVRTIANERPAVIITDISMPGVDGWTFIQHLKTDEDTAAIPVVVLTAYADEATKVKALAAGATFFPKPFTASELMAEMNYLIYGDRSRDRRRSERT